MKSVAGVLAKEVYVTRMNVNEAVREALFASMLQPSDALTAGTVADAIGSTVRRLGPSGCASRMAEEFGHHPQESVDRMRWICQLTNEMSGCLYFPSTMPTTTTTCGTDLLPVREAA